MYREYLMPKIIIIIAILLFIIKPTSVILGILLLLLSILIALLYEILKLAVIGKYYLYQLKKGKEVSKDKVYRTVRKFVLMVNRIIRLEVTVHNYQYFEPSKNYFITPNHQSNVDALLMMEVFKSHFLFVSKFSMSKFIIVKDWMKLLDCLFLKKDDFRGQILVMNEAAEKLTNGENVMIFPEGKRSFGKVMNEFKAGTFKVAQKTHVDILPVTLNHVYKLRYRYPFRKTVMNVHFHKPIPYEQYKDLSTNEIAQLVQTTIESKIE